MSQAPTYTTSDGRSFSLPEAEPAARVLPTAPDLPEAPASAPPMGVRLHAQTEIEKEDRWPGAPGAFFYTTHDKCPYWDNCDGQHLHVVCPDGHVWDVDSRANNCTLRDDRTHRCWVRIGTPPNVTVGKGGHTCAAGAGSIQTYAWDPKANATVPSWHGFLRNGELVS